MKNTLKLSLALATCIPLIGCDILSPEKGCTDRNALNFDVGADEDDGSCQFSRVIFYKAVDGPPASVTLDGAAVEEQPLFTQDPETEIYGLLYMIPADGLEIGRHTLVVARRYPEEEEPGEVEATSEEVDEEGGRQFTILFWKGERD